MVLHRARGVLSATLGGPRQTRGTRTECVQPSRAQGSPPDGMGLGAGLGLAVGSGVAGSVGAAVAGSVGAGVGVNDGSSVVGNCVDGGGWAPTSARR